MLVFTLDESDCIIIGDATSNDAIVIKCVRAQSGKSQLAFHLPDSVRCDRFKVAKLRLVGTGKKLARHIELVAAGDLEQLKALKKELENCDKTTE